MICVLVSCGGRADDLLPPTQGGAGVVISLNKLDGGPDASVDVGGSTGSGGKGGAGGHSSGGGVAGMAVGGSSGGSAGGAGAAGGVGGGAPQDDPCTACEKSRCSHPAGLTDNTSDQYAEQVGAYEVCFLGTGWPSDIADPASFCGGLQGATGAVAVTGPARGTAKTTLCQAILKCVHHTVCTEGEAVDNQLECYCGAGVSLSTCQAPGFTPTGSCADQVAAGLEVTQFATSAGYFTDQCLANGAAFFLYDFCDANCCEQECLGVTPSGAEDLTQCNAPGSGGTNGAGGSLETGGGGHGGGSAGSGGAIGSGGNHGGAGGNTGNGGAGASGTAGTVGSLGTGGSSGTGGAVGSLLQNVHFDLNTASWTPSVGATLARSPNNATSGSQSGSLDVTLIGGDPSIASQVAATQCLAVAPGVSYALGVEILIPGQVGSQGALGLWYYPSADCSGALAGVFMAPSSTTNAWQNVTATAQIPSNVHTALLRLLVLKPLGQQSAESLFDDVAVTRQ